MTRQQVLKNLKENIYCRIGTSKIHGVGVIAIRDIPKGTNPFIGSFSGAVYKFTDRELSIVSPAVKRMTEDYFTGNNGKTFIPVCGLNGIDISYFMNHSEDPNIYTDENGEIFSALKQIKTGEELTISYTKYYGAEKATRNDE